MARRRVIRGVDQMEPEGSKVCGPRIVSACRGRRASNEGVKRRDHAERPVIEGCDCTGLHRAAGRQNRPRSVFHLRDQTPRRPHIASVGPAHAEGKKVEVAILNDADLEPGKVTFDFDDPGVAILDVSVHDLRSATVRTNRADLRGKKISFDVLTQFHRHYGEAVVE